MSPLPRWKSAMKVLHNLIGNIKGSLVYRRLRILGKFKTIPKILTELKIRTEDWSVDGGANDWGGMSLDKKRGMVFLALGSPTYDYYGGARKGKNLFGNCVVALNARTGKLIWYYQTVHHDLWDYDLPAPPNLVTVERDGKKIDAVAQVSKTGFG